MSSVNLLKKSDLLKESESEHGDKTYLVRTDLAGQVHSTLSHQTVKNYLPIFQKVAPTYGTATMEGSPCSLTRQLELADMAELLYRWVVLMLMLNRVTW